MKLKVINGPRKGVLLDIIRFHFRSTSTKVQGQGLKEKKSVLPFTCKDVCYLLEIQPLDISNVFWVVLKIYD